MSISDRGLGSNPNSWCNGSTLNTFYILSEILFMKILIATDAWEPQINGVVTTLKNTIKSLNDHTIKVISPNDFVSFPSPFYKEIRLSLPDIYKLFKIIDEFQPDSIHIPVEGPIGWMTQLYCWWRGLKFTTAYHTKFPEYLNKYFHIPNCIGYLYTKAFHKNSSGVMVACNSLIKDLGSRGFKNIKYWPRGVDIDIFKPSNRINDKIALYVGRISKEKNIDAFLKCKIDGLRKVVVGSGPILQKLIKEYPEIVFVGAKAGTELANFYKNADVLVFPSRTDTFGLVILEALASGTPVAAYNVTGPKDIIVDKRLGSINEDLELAIKEAIHNGDRQFCRKYAEKMSWEYASQLFSLNLVRVK